MLGKGMMRSKVVTGKCRFSYANLFTPRAMGEGQVLKYSVCLLIPKEDRETLFKINKAIYEVTMAGAELWGGKIPNNLKTPLRDGDEDEEKVNKPEYAGYYFINTVSKNKPGVVDKNLKEISDSQKLYSGCYGKASIYFYPYCQGEKIGIGCGLWNVQKLEEGEPLGARRRPEDDFEASDDDILG